MALSEALAKSRFGVRDVAKKHRFADDAGSDPDNGYEREQMPAWGDVKHKL